MNAGPELDALIAKKIMGWTKGYHNGDMHWPEVWTRPNGGPGNVPPFSTDIATAWTVIEKVRTLDLKVILEITSRGLIRCLIYSFDREIDIACNALTAPLAICLAALTTQEKA